MFFELQLSSQVFGRVVRNRLKAIPACVDQEFDKDGTHFVIDQVDIVDATVIQKQTLPSQIVWTFLPTNYWSSTVPFLQVKQGVTVRLVKSTDLDQNGPDPSTPSAEFTISPVFNVSVQVIAAHIGEGGPIQISYTFDHIDYGILDTLLPAANKDQIEKTLSSYQLTPTTVDLSAFSHVLNRPVSAINAGITCDAEGNFVAMRIEIRADGDLLPGFFTQDPTSVLGQDDWALLVDAHILTEEASKKVKDGLANVAKFKLQGEPSVSWNASDPALDISLSGTALDACLFFVDNIDMDVDVDIRAVLSVPQTNVLRTHYHFHPSPSDAGEVILCAATAALLWPFIGLAMFDQDKINLPEYLLGLLIGETVTFVASFLPSRRRGYRMISPKISERTVRSWTTRTMSAMTTSMSLCVASVAVCSSQRSEGFLQAPYCLVRSPTRTSVQERS